MLSLRGATSGFILAMWGIEPPAVAEVTAKTDLGEEPVSPSPRVGRDAWSEKGEPEQGSQLSFNVRGTIERRKKVYMGSKSGHIGRYR